MAMSGVTCISRVEEMWFKRSFEGSQGGRWIHPTVWPQINRHGPIFGGAVPALLGESGVPISHNDAWAEAHLRTKWLLNPYSRLATTDMGRN